MKITDNFTEMAELGRKYILEHPAEYMQIEKDRFRPLFDSEEELLVNLYAAIYCQQVYGTNKKASEHSEA